MTEELLIALGLTFISLGIVLWALFAWMQPK